jgi:2-phospho-L-lactate guanylyltransferase
MRTLFAHVVHVCRCTPTITSVHAVVGDAEGEMLARQSGVPSLRETTGGLNAALTLATRQVGDDASLVVVADLPHLAVSDLTRLTAAGRQGPCVVVARTHDGGTGALLRRPPDVIDPAFGVASAAAHLAAAQRAGVRAVLVSSEGLAHDVDRPGDLPRPGDGPLARL